MAEFAGVLKDAYGLRYKKRTSFERPFFPLNYFSVT
jgi:hypothetical protein